MKYFINENQRKERRSTCFFEFQRGKYDGECWKEDSLNIPCDLFDAMGLGKILDEALTDFDYYGTTEVNYEQWEKIKELLSEKGGEFGELLAELEPWAEDNFKEFNVFNLWGI